jgi:hypothetical protein
LGNGRKVKGGKKRGRDERVGEKDGGRGRCRLRKRRKRGKGNVKGEVKEGD